MGECQELTSAEVSVLFPEVSVEEYEVDPGMHYFLGMDQRVYRCWSSDPFNAPDHAWLPSVWSVKLCQWVGTTDDLDKQDQ